MPTKDIDDFGGMSGPPGLMEENEMLRRQITELQNQVLDLRQMNDQLYDQNTRYRAQLGGNHTLANTAPNTDPYNKTAVNTSIAASAPAAAPATAGFMMPTYYSHLKY